MGAEAARTLWGRRLSWRQRLGRGALIVTLVAVTLFALLGGPALTVTGWQRLTFALRSGTLAPRLAMTDWQRVPPPPGVAPDALSYATDPADPLTVSPASPLLAASSSGAATRWASSWLRIVVAQTPAQTCQIKTTLDSSSRVLIIARAPDPLRAGCQRIAVYLSEFAGNQWAPMTLPAEATGAAACQSDVWASARWVFAWWTDAAQPEPATSLMRSADAGQTWQRGRWRAARALAPTSRLR